MSEVTQERNLQPGDRVKLNASGVTCCDGSAGMTPQAGRGALGTVIYGPDGDGDVRVRWDELDGVTYCDPALLDLVASRTDDVPDVPDEQSVPDDLVVDAQVLGVLSDVQQCRVTALHEARQVLGARHIFGSSAPSVWDLISAAEWILSGRGLTVEADDE